MKTIVLLALLPLLHAYNPPEFSFNNKLGADRWSEVFPDFCAGQKQSPINIDTRNTRFDEPLNTSALFTAQRTGRDFTVSNSGFQLEVDVTQLDLKFRGLHLPDVLSVAHFHFHWGDKDNVGSAHTLNGRSFPLEIHIVLLNTKYGDLTQMLRHSDGIIGLAVLFKIGKHNSVLQPVVNAIQNVTEPGATAIIDSFPLENLLPPAGKRLFYRYAGSVDVPNCDEAVDWTVFAHPLEISAEQLSQFRKMRAAVPKTNGTTFPMVNNFRPVQQLNGRVVRRSAVEGSGSSLFVNAHWMFVLIATFAAHLLHMRA